MLARIGSVAEAASNGGRSTHKRPNFDAASATRSIPALSLHQQALLLGSRGARGGGEGSGALLKGGEAVPSHNASMPSEKGDASQRGLEVGGRQGRGSG